MRSPETPRLPLRSRLQLLALGCVLGLILGEVAARGLSFWIESRKLADWNRMREGTATPDPSRDATLGEIVGPSDLSGVVYELIPNAVVRFRGVPCKTNEVGFRDAPLPAGARSSAELRIVALGDSVLFGWGVEEPQGFVRRLEAALRERLPGRHVCTVNTGVPGYNTSMEVAAFEHKALHLRPDVVLLDWVGNDADLPNLVANRSSALDPTRCFLYDLARKAIGWRSKWQTGPLRDAPFAGEHYERDPQRVPEAYREMVGEQGVTRALRRLSELARIHGFRVLVSSHYGVPDFVRRESEALGFGLLDGTEDVHRLLSEQGLRPEDYRRSDLVLSPDDPHPSPRAHAAYAQRLADWLVDKGYCESSVISPR